MSKKKNTSFQPWKSLLIYERGKTFKRNGILLSKSGCRVYADALVLWAAVAYDALPSNSKDMFLQRDLGRLMSHVNNMDVLELIGCLKAADELLLSSTNVENFAVTTYDGFKRHLKTNGYVDAGVVISPMKAMLEEWFTSHDVASFRILHTYFAYLSRLSFNKTDTTDLQKKAEEDFIEHEKGLGIGVVLYQKVGDIISKWFPYESWDQIIADFDPHHGNGAVAENVEPNTFQGYTQTRANSKKNKDMFYKYKHMTFSKELVELAEAMNFDLSLIPGYTDDKVKETLAPSRVQFVPKTAQKLRTVCMEPIGNMYFQEGFASALIKYFEHHSYLRRRIKLTDQEQNRSLAEEGSYYGYYSTIDLSAASDSVLDRHIQEWFDNSSLYFILELTRSKKCVLPSGRLLNMKKFAPMGSALCFPVECIVFAAIVEYSIWQYGDNPKDSHYSIYGDDIIVETKYVKFVMDNLVTFGFKVNTEKSFYNIGSINFRESCGGEYINGVDVKPARIPRGFKGLGMSLSRPEQVLGLIDMCNAYVGKYPTARRLILSEFQNLPKEYRPVFSKDEQGIFSHTATNYQLSSKNKEAQLILSSNSWRADLVEVMTSDLYVVHGQMKVEQLVYPKDIAKHGLENPERGSVSADSILWSSDEALYEQVRYYEHLRATAHRDRLLYYEDRVDINPSPITSKKWVSTVSLDPVA